MLTVVVCAAEAFAGKRPRVCCTTVFGRFQFADRDTPFDADTDPAPRFAFGTDRMFALTSTSIFGIVYAASALSVVKNGSLMSHELIGWLTPRIATSASGRRSEEGRVGKESRSRWLPYH